MKKVLFDEAIYSFLKFLKNRLKYSTYETNERKIKKYILDFFIGKNIYSFEMRDYINWQMYIESFNFSYNYKSSLHYCFTTFLDFCMIYYGIEKNIAKIIGNFRNDDIKKIGNIWTIEEFEKFIQVVDNPIYKCLFNFLYFTGCRKGECLALTFDDIDFENHTVYINKTITRFLKNGKKIITTPKTKSSIRTISLDDFMFYEIIKLREYYITNYNNFNNSFYIFGGINSISFTTLKRKKDKYCDLANVKRIKIHEFRHSHTCLLYENKVPIQDISKRLGHTDISITMGTYLKNLPRKEKRVISTLNSIRLNY